MVEKGIISVGAELQRGRQGTRWRMRGFACITGSSRRRKLGRSGNGEGESEKCNKVLPKEKAMSKMPHAKVQAQ